MTGKHCYQTLMFIPNLIGYVRLFLCSLAVFHHYKGSFLWCIFFFLLNFALDGIDGYVARKLNQTSTFGAWFDVFVDLVARGFLWILVDEVVGYCIITWEWLAFFAIHSLFGRKWKTPMKAPRFVRFVMKNNFKTVHGVYIIGSLFFLPAWCYTMIYLSDLLPTWLSAEYLWCSFSILCIGRSLAATAELWYISEFIKSLLVPAEDEPEKSS